MAKHWTITEAEDLSDEARSYYDLLDEDEQEEMLRLADEYEEQAIVAFLDWHGYLDGLRDFEDLYEGKWEDDVEFAKHLIDECYNLEQMMGDLARFFDYEAFADELFDNDYTMEDDGYVFRWG